ncbi:hypothetical protein D3C78_1422410 [compost metagenome]
MLNNHAHGLLQLEAAIAARAAEYITGMTNAVHTNNGIFARFEISVHEHTGLLQISIVEPIQVLHKLFWRQLLSRFLPKPAVPLKSYCFTVELDGKLDGPYDIDIVNAA